MHRVVDYCSDRLWIVVAIIILVVSGYVMLGRYLANSVQLYRADIVELVEQGTGLHAEVGELSGRWAFFTPVIELSQVDLFQSSGVGEPIVSAEKLVLELDVLASLFVQEPRLVKLNLYGLELSLQRNAEGKYTLWGLNNRNSAGQGQSDLLPIILRQDLLTLHDSKITVALESGDSLVISDVDIGLKRFAGFYQLAASTEMNGQSLRLVTEINGNPLEWDTNDMEVYLRVGKGDLLHWLPKELLGDLAKRTSVALNQWHAGAEVWAKWEHGQLRSVRGFLYNELLDFNYKDAKEAVVFSQLDSQFQLDMDAKKNVQLQLQDLTFSLEEIVWPKSAVKVNLNPDAGTADVQIDRGELAPLSTLLLYSGVLNERTQEMFRALALKGSFENTLVHLEKDSEEAFFLSADLNAIQCQQWKNIPAVDGLSGQIQLGPRKGVIQIDSEQLGLASPLYFRQRLLVDTLQGPVSWHIDENKVTVQSANLTLSNMDVEGAFVFGVNTPRHKKEKNKEQNRNVQQQHSPQDTTKQIKGEPSPETGEPQHIGAELYLVARFDNIIGQSLSLYLPPSLPQDVLQWLDAGLLEGQLNGRFVYHGSLNWKHPLAQHTLQTQLNFANASVDYLPNEWPLLSKANGSLFIDENNVSFVVEEGEVWDSSVEITQGFVGRTEKKPLVHVSLDGAYKSTMLDALRLLNETPLKEVVGGSALTWQGSGDVNGKMTLSVPLEKSEEEMALDVVAHFYKASLSLPDFDLIFSDLNGQLNYNNSDGLFSDGMQAHLFGYPADIVLPKFDMNDGTLFRLDLDSQISLRTLTDWSRQPLLSFMDGVINYHGELSIVNPDAVTTILRIFSDTEGMRVDLPAPFEKSKDQARGTLFQMLNQGEIFHYYIRQDQVFDTYLKMHRDELDTLRMVIGEERDIPEGRQGVSIAGSVDKLNWDVWQRDLTLLEHRYDELEANKKNGNSDSSDSQPESLSFIDMISGIDLHAKQFDGFGLQVPNLSANVIRHDQSWWVNARSEMVKGVFKVPDNDRPIALDLDYFYMPEDEGVEPDENGSAPIADKTSVTEQSILEMKPAEFPALSVKIADLQIDGWKLGQWTFTGTPVGELYYIDDLEVKLADQTLNAKAVWRSDGEQSITDLVGKSHGKDVGKLMATWGHTPTIESDNTSLDFELSWPHSPLDFSFDKVSGNAKIKIKDGRFLDVGAASAIRVLGILNFAEVGRRLRLDFGDLIKTGHSFNRIEGPMSFHRGTLEFKKLKIDSPSSRMVLTGDMDLVDDSLDMTMDVELEITKNLVAIAALVGGPAAGGGMFLIDRLIGDRLAKIASLKYIVSGTLNSPEMKLKL